MQPAPHAPPAEVALSEAETIALAYLRDARGDRWAAIRARGRQVSHGFVRGRING